MNSTLMGRDPITRDRATTRRAPAAYTLRSRREEIVAQRGQDLAEQVLPLPHPRVLRARIRRRQADAPDLVVRARLDERRALGRQQEVAQLRVVRELGVVPRAHDRLALASPARVV